MFSALAPLPLRRQRQGVSAVAAQSHPTAEQVEAEADPLRQLRLRYGDHEAHSGRAMRDAHPALEQAWFQGDEERGVGILELWFRPGTSEVDRSTAARAAYEVLRAWVPQLDQWDVRARTGREHPDPRKGYLGRRENELDLLARARAKRLR